MMPCLPFRSATRLPTLYLLAALCGCSGDRPTFGPRGGPDAAADTASDPSVSPVVPTGDATTTQPDSSDTTPRDSSSSPTTGGTTLAEDETSAETSDEQTSSGAAGGPTLAPDAGSGTSDQPSSTETDASVSDEVADASSPDELPDAPTIAAFLSSDHALPGGGGRITLSWEVADANEIEISPEVGVVSGSAVQVDVNQRTTFTLTATNEGGASSEAITVDVSARGTRDWILQYGSRDDKGDSVAGLVVDTAGALILVGSSTGIFSDDLAVTDDSYDAVVAKLDEDGNPLWVRQLGASSGGQDLASDVALDQDGSVIVGGDTSGVLHEDSHVDSSRNGMIAKYSNDGELLWVRQLGSQDAESVGNLGTYGYGTAVDSFNSVYLVGKTSRVLDASGGTKLGTEPDAFIAKYSSDGLLLWKRQLDSENSGYDQAWDIAVDGTDRIYVSGSTSSSFEAEQASAGADDAFLAQYDINGNRVWLRQFGTADYDSANSVATDPAGFVYTAGHFAMSGNYLTEFTRPFLAKYDAEGEQVWLREFVTLHSMSDVAAEVAVDLGGSVYIAGTTQGAAGANTPASLTNAQDTFVAKYSADGDLIWVQQVQADDAQYGGALAVSPHGYVFIGGSIYGTVGENTIENVSMTADMFIARYR